MNIEQRTELALAILEKYLQTKSPAALKKFWKLYPRPIPNWHLPMMNDETRNLFYEKEIQAKAKNKVVMDLGCGSGLLTQYALDAGASHVYALEQDPVLQKCFAFAFKDEIAAGRVTLLAKKSQDLKSEDFTSGPPEVVVHEIFGNTLFNERVLETFTDLFSRNILAPDLTYIPQKFSLWAALHRQKFESRIHDPRYADKFWFLEDISYFGTPVAKSSGQAQNGEDVSEDFEIFSVDMKKLPLKLESEREVVASSEGNMLRFWIKLHGECSTLSTDIKVNPLNHWQNSKFFLRFPQGNVEIKASYQEGKFLTYLLKT
jgi:hypothetical protein